ncbi:phosphatase PAP2 family protein [Parasphingorhabdus sp.]|uniref:phosphatase PAP2 family protein n=1 Tax=Parasphingorhabdus sp. TaxID=2709688 RepID=UPI003C787507
MDMSDVQDIHIDKQTLFARIVPTSWFLGLLACSLLIVVAMMGWAGLSMDFFKPSNSKYFLLLTLLAAIRYLMQDHSTGWQRIARDFCEYVGFFLFISLLGATATYPAAAATTGFVDPALARIDAFLGFVWMDWYLLVVNNPWLQSAGSFAYANIYVSPLLLLGGLAINGERARAQMFLFSFWLAAVITMMLFLAFPAVGPLAYVWQGPVPYMPTSALYQAELIPLLRNDLFYMVDLGALQGLVCAPSFHTAAAVIYIAMAWQCRYLRWPLLAINAAMLLSTPVEGTHYLIDMIGGAIVGLFALCTAGAIQYSLPKMRRQRRWRETGIWQNLTSSSSAAVPPAVQSRDG